MNNEVCDIKSVNLNIVHDLNPTPTPIPKRIACENSIYDNENTILNSVEKTDVIAEYMLDMEKNPIILLKKIKLANFNRIVIAHLNINSLRNKFEALKAMIIDNIDILVITETKIDESFPLSQFLIDGYNRPFRMDRTSDGGGIIIYVRQDIPCKQLKTHNTIGSMEGIFFEIRIRGKKWLLFGGYNPKKEKKSKFISYVVPILNYYIGNYDNILILGDFNSETTETVLGEFCETFNLTNLINKPTCFKNPSNPSCIDVLLTNRRKCFQNTKIIETGLSDHHKLTITVMKSLFIKNKPITINYRDYRKFNENKFRADLNEILSGMNEMDVGYENFENSFVELLNKHAPMEKRISRANNAPFMNKRLSKAVMNRSRLRNKYLTNPTVANKRKYTRY